MKNQPPAGKKGYVREIPREFKGRVQLSENLKIGLQQVDNLTARKRRSVPLKEKKSRISPGPGYKPCVSRRRNVNKFPVL